MDEVGQVLYRPRTDVLFLCLSGHLPLQSVDGILVVSAPKVTAHLTILPHPPVFRSARDLAQDVLSQLNALQAPFTRPASWLEDAPAWSSEAYLERLRPVLEALIRAVEERDSLRAGQRCKEIWRRVTDFGMLDRRPGSGAAPP